MVLLRAILLTTDEQRELLEVRDRFRDAMTESHDGPDEIGAYRRLTQVQERVAVVHGLEPVKCGFAYSIGDYSSSVVAHYPLTREEERAVRGLG